MKKILFCFVFLQFTACKTKTEDSFVACFDNVETIDLNSEIIKIHNDNIFFSYLYGMEAIEDLLILNDPSPSHLLKIMNLQTNEIRIFGKKGKGPQELNTTIADFSIDYTNKNLYVTDNSKYLVYSINDLQEGLDIPHTTIDFKKNIPHDSFMTSAYCNSGYIIGSMHHKRFGVYDIQKKNISSKYKYEVSPLVNQGQFFNHPVEGKIAFFQSKYSSVSILSIKNKAPEIIYDKTWWKTKDKPFKDGNVVTTVPDPNLRFGFLDATTSEKFIYLSYSGKYLDKRDPIDSILSDMIYVFDWQGNPKKRFKLDKTVRAIAVDEKGGVLYASTYDEGVPSLIKFSI